MDLLLLLSILTSAYAAMAGLGLSMDKHFEQVFAQEPNLIYQRLLHWGGWLCLLLCLWLCIQGWELAIGFVVWFGTFTFMQGAFALLLAYRQQWTPMLLWGSAAVALAGVVFLLNSRG